MIYFLKIVSTSTANTKLQNLLVRFWLTQTDLESSKANLVFLELDFVLCISNEEWSSRLFFKYRLWLVSTVTTFERDYRFTDCKATLSSFFSKFYKVEGLKPFKTVSSSKNDDALRRNRKLITITYALAFTEVCLQCATFSSF